MLTLAALAAEVAVAGLIWSVLLGAWLFVGLGYSAVLTPSGRLLRRSAHPEDVPLPVRCTIRAQPCLLTYPLSGWMMTQFGLVPTLGVMTALAGAGIMAALLFWPSEDPETLEHTHDNLPSDHPHLQGTRTHAHTFVVDENHPRWASKL